MGWPLSVCVLYFQPSEFFWKPILVEASKSSGNKTAVPGSFQKCCGLWNRAVVFLCGAMCLCEHSGSGCHSRPNLNDADADFSGQEDSIAHFLARSVTKLHKCRRHVKPSGETASVLRVYLSSHATSSPAGMLAGAVEPELVTRRSRLRASTSGSDTPVVPVEPSTQEFQS